MTNLHLPHKRLLLPLFLAGFSLCLQAQLPETDLWLFDLVKKKDKGYQAEKGRNITNRPGYDNQPCFSKDQRFIYYVSICEDNQADVYTYDLRKKQVNRLTDTPVSEYSPQPTPDGKALACVVVEPDSAQRVWLYSLLGHVQKPLHEGTDSVGYYSWLGTDSILYYKLTEPHTLHALDPRTGRDATIGAHPTRAFRALPASPGFIYALKTGTSTEFRIYDPVLRQSRVYAACEGVAEDFLWTAPWGLVRSEQSRLLRYNEATRNWEPLFDFESQGIRKITRFAFDEQYTRVVVVSNT